MVADKTFAVVIHYVLAIVIADEKAEDMKKSAALFRILKLPAGNGNSGMPVTPEVPVVRVGDVIDNHLAGIELLFALRMLL